MISWLRQAPKLCVRTLKALEDGSVVREKQGESPTEYARMLTKELGCIDWTKDAAIHRTTGQEA